MTALEFGSCAVQMFSGAILKAATVLLISPRHVMEFQFALEIVFDPSGEEPLQLGKYALKWNCYF